jgi:hypothetical protein
MMRLRRVFAGIVLLAACSRADLAPPLERPSADEYAVWSAAVDSRFGPLRLRMVVEERTDLGFLPYLRGKPELEALAADHVHRNRHPAWVDAGRIRARQVSLVPDLGGLAGSAADLVSHGRLTVSRVGFDRGGKRALVTLHYWCGARCAEGAMLVMERGADGRWRHTSTVMEAYS